MLLQLAALLCKPPAVMPRSPAPCCRQQVMLVLQLCSRCLAGSTIGAPVAGRHASSTVAVNVGQMWFGKMPSTDASAASSNILENPLLVLWQQQCWLQCWKRGQHPSPFGQPLHAAFPHASVARCEASGECQLPRRESCFLSYTPIEGPISKP